VSRAAVALVLALAGCADEHWVEFRLLTSPPAPVTLTSAEVALPAGVAVGVEVIPFENNRRLEDGVSVELVSHNASVLGVDRGLENRVFVLIGAGAGATTMDLVFGDELVGDMRATVLAR
jgi:hypothetical protein